MPRSHRLRSGLLEQLAAIAQQQLDVGQGIELGGFRLLMVLDHHLQGSEPLLQLHQPVGEGRDGLGQILRRAGDAKGNRFRSHPTQGNRADHNTECPAAQAISQTGCPLDQLQGMSSPPTLVVYLLAGLAGGLLALRTGIPAAPLAGALLGAGLVSMSGRWEVAVWPNGTRTVLEIAIGTVIGTGLSSVALLELRQLWRPAILITVTLVATGLVVGLWSSRLLGVDPIITLLGAAPGGITGMSLVGAGFGVGAAVAALHAVRLITVLLVLPVIVRFVLSFTAGHSSG